MNIKVFNQMSKINETCHIEWHESCKCKYRLDASVCNDKQCWNNGKCKCESRELLGKGRCDNRFFCNSSICEYECDKSCDAGEYLDYKNCRCRKKLIEMLVDECSQGSN